MIKKIIDKIFCLHTWDLEDTVKMTRYWDSEEYKIYHINTYICTKCGKFKQIKLS